MAYLNWCAVLRSILTHITYAFINISHYYVKLMLQNKNDTNVIFYSHVICDIVKIFFVNYGFFECLLGEVISALVSRGEDLGFKSGWRSRSPPPVTQL